MIVEVVAVAVAGRSFGGGAQLLSFLGKHFTAPVLSTL
jgi:hypothetical protein